MGFVVLFWSVGSPFWCTVLNGAQVVSGPLTTHTSHGWTVMNLVTGTDAASAAPAATQAAADNRKPHTAWLWCHLKSLIFRLPFVGRGKLLRFFPDKCKLVHTWPTSQAIFPSAATLPGA